MKGRRMDDLCRRMDEVLRRMDDLSAEWSRNDRSSFPPNGRGLANLAKAGLECDTVAQFDSSRTIQRRRMDDFRKP